MSQLAILAFGGYLAIDGHITVGNFVTFFQYLNMLVFPVQSLGEMVPTGQRATTAAARVWNVLRRRPTIAKSEDGAPMPAGG